MSGKGGSKKRLLQIEEVIEVKGEDDKRHTSSMWMLLIGEQLLWSFCSSD